MTQSSGASIGLADGMSGSTRSGLRSSRRGSRRSRPRGLPDQVDVHADRLVLGAASDEARDVRLDVRADASLPREGRCATVRALGGTRPGRRRASFRSGPVKNDAGSAFAPAPRGRPPPPRPMRRSVPPGASGAAREAGRFSPASLPRQCGSTRPSGSSDGRAPSSARHRRRSAGHGGATAVRRSGRRSRPGAVTGRHSVDLHAPGGRSARAPRRALDPVDAVRRAAVRLPVGGRARPVRAASGPELGRGGDRAGPVRPRPGFRRRPARRRDVGSGGRAPAGWTCGHRARASLGHARPGPRRRLARWSMPSRRGDPMEWTGANRGRPRCLRMEWPSIHAARPQPCGGAFPCLSAERSPAAPCAASRPDRAVDAARSTRHQFGSSTPSTTWMTPFDCITSAMVTR